MRTISLVPSWTETLIRAGIQVVGRTRYCIHPSSEVAKIPVVGGTKNVDWDKISQLKPDLILVDREENPAEFVSRKQFQFIVTHVTDLQSLGSEFDHLFSEYKNSSLIRWRDQLNSCLESPPAKGAYLQSRGLLNWISGNRSEASDDVLYVIWKKPWMAVSDQTYIGSVLKWCGARSALSGLPKYPEIDLGAHPEPLLLFSSEPFPFGKFTDELRGLSRPAALVDGECFSWFGVRGLEFLKSLSAGASR